MLAGDVCIFTVFTARELRQGNVFTPVSDSVHRGISVQGASVWRVSVQGASVWRVSVQGSLCPDVSLSRGVSVQGDLCPQVGSLSRGGVSVQG